MRRAETFLKTILGIFLVFILGLAGGNAVAQIKYQLRRFEKQCAELPESTRVQVARAMQPLRDLLQAIDESEESV